MTIMHSTMKAAVLSLAAVLLCGTGAMAQTKLTVGVGHMCCGGCKAGAKAAVAKVADDVTIDGKNVTMTLKGNDIEPALEALRKGGFPATRIDVPGGPITVAVGHMCCGGCVASLKAAMADVKSDALDTDSMKISQGAMAFKVKDGSTLDLAPVLVAMEKGGFSAVKITIGAVSARRAPVGRSAHKVAAR